jgi:hypothetical protein
MNTNMNKGKVIYPTGVAQTANVSPSSSQCNSVTSPRSLTASCPLCRRHYPPPLANPIKASERNRGPHVARLANGGGVRLFNYSIRRCQSLNHSYRRRNEMGKEPCSTSAGAGALGKGETRRGWLAGDHHLWSVLARGSLGRAAPEGPDDI